jgi:hypothetical protein
MRRLVLLLVGCGRIAFDPRVDPGVDGDGGASDRDGGMVTPCIEGLMPLPVTPGYALGRLPTGWAIVGLDSARTEMQLRVVSDDGDIGPLIPLTSVTGASTVHTVVWLGSSLTVLWSSSGIVNHGRFTLAGTMLDSGSLGVPVVTRGTGAGIQDELAFELQQVVTGDVTVSRVDAAGTLAPLLLLASGANPRSVAHGTDGYLVMWQDSSNVTRLTGLDEAGNRVTPDMQVVTSGDTRIVWTGSEYLVMWRDGDQLFLRTFDRSFSGVSGPTTLMLVPDPSSGLFGWNGQEIAFVSLVSSPEGITFQAADLTGASTSPRLDFIPATSTSSISGVDVVAGPRRFGMLFGLGSPLTETYLVTVCR